MQIISFLFNSLLVLSLNITKIGQLPAHLKFSQQILKMVDEMWTGSQVNENRNRNYGK